MFIFAMEFDSETSWFCFDALFHTLFSHAIVLASASVHSRTCAFVWSIIYMHVCIHWLKSTLFAQVILVNHGLDHKSNRSSCLSQSQPVNTSQSLSISLSKSVSINQSYSVSISKSQSVIWSVNRSVD